MMSTKFTTLSILVINVISVFFINPTDATLCASTTLPSYMPANTEYTLTGLSNTLQATAVGKIRIIDNCNFRIINATFTRIPANTYVYGLFTPQLGYRLSDTPVANYTSSNVNSFTLLNRDLGTGKGPGIAFTDFNTFRIFNEVPNGGVPIADATINGAPSPSPSNTNGTPSSPTPSTSSTISPIASNSNAAVASSNVQTAASTLAGALISLFFF